MPQAIAAVAAWATAEFIAATATTSLIAASAVYAAAYVATSYAVYAGLNYALSAVGGGGPNPQTQGQLVSSKQAVAANRHVIGRARVAGVTGWQGSFAWKSGDDLNKGFGQVQVLSATPITEIEAVLAADIELIGTAAIHQWGGPFDLNAIPDTLAANMAPYNLNQITGVSRLYYRSSIGAEIGTRDPLLGYFADQIWQPLISSPDPAVPGDVPFYSIDARGDGLATLASAAYEDVSSFPQGPPRMSAVVKGIKCFDPRGTGQDPTDSSTWEFSQNPALLAAWYVTRPFSFAADYDHIDTETLIAAANACDEEVETFESTGAAGDPPMEPRFFCGGEVSEDDNRDLTLQAIIASMAGSWCVSGGVWFFYAGVYAEPTIDIDETWIMRSVIFTAQRSRLQLYNTVNGSFVSEARRWQAAPYPQVQDPAILAADNGVEIIETSDMAYVQSHTVAQRVALIGLRRTHKPRSFKFETPLGFALRLIIGQTVALTQIGYGIDDVPFRVASWELSTQDDTGEIWVTVNLDEDGADIYDATIADLTDAAALNAPDPPVFGSDAPPDPSDPPGGEGESVIV